MANIRVSERAKAELARIAAEEGRSVVAVVDRLLFPEPGIASKAWHKATAASPHLLRAKELKYERDE